MRRQIERFRGRPSLRALLISAVVVALTGPGSGLPVDQRIPQIELKAPGAFNDPASTAISAVGVTYQVNATVLLPLLVVSVPLVDRDDVGVASAAVRDFAAGNGLRLRVYEFFATSKPQRARGLNRLGLLRETTQLGPDGVRWTAHFGVVSSTRETTREEAEEHLDRDERIQKYTILDGFTDRSRAWSTTVQLDLEGEWPTAAALYADLRPRWAAAEPDEETTLKNEGGRAYRDAVGFLGAVQHSLRVAAADAKQGGTPRRFRYAFGHNSKVYSLDLVGTRSTRAASTVTRRLI